ncbi:hypothetical protein P7D22_09670 [Lichenihabitans sp. Uapishka_5]|uniref:hypothetical protein n=1 Tax=Lichenihabitans sp. Uapishka_5 TaxID=3037302 RepID=UPI0029E82166|nr:hypothetical protein [Lichenihabitans sp. Uapishka_5]MDX7951436.1 hypothetical protein [Lichenihabitans sp. Uapishka_5]
MFRSILFVLGCAFLCSLAVALVYFRFEHSKSYADATTIKSFAEFDFSSYAFGIVAVAVSFAGVYVSVVPDRCSDQIAKLLQVHLTPDPFQDLGEIESKCHPKQGVQGYIQTEGVKSTYALVVLSRWVSLEPSVRKTLLGVDGISSNRRWLGTAFEFFQSQRDRFFVTVLGACTSVLYASVPIAYWLNSERLAVAVLKVVYLLCLIEMICCAVLYLIRISFLGVFEDRMAPWRNEIRNHLLLIEEKKIEKVGI